MYSRPELMLEFFPCVGIEPQPPWTCLPEAWITGECYIQGSQYQIIRSYLFYYGIKSTASPIRLYVKEQYHERVKYSLFFKAGPPLEGHQIILSCEKKQCKSVFVFRH